MMRQSEIQIESPSANEVSRPNTGMPLKPSVHAFTFAGNGISGLQISRLCYIVIIESDHCEG